MDKDLEKEIEKARKNVRYMEKSGQKDTVHHQNLERLLALKDKPIKKGKELMSNG